MAERAHLCTCTRAQVGGAQPHAVVQTTQRDQLCSAEVRRIMIIGKAEDVEVVECWAAEPSNNAVCVLGHHKEADMGMHVTIESRILSDLVVQG